jgi:hypothetical protein
MANAWATSSFFILSKHLSTALAPQTKDHMSIEKMKSFFSATIMLALSLVFLAEIAFTFDNTSNQNIAVYWVRKKHSRSIFSTLFIPLLQLHCHKLTLQCFL